MVLWGRVCGIGFSTLQYIKNYIYIHLFIYAHYYESLGFNWFDEFYDVSGCLMMFDDVWDILTISDDNLLEQINVQTCQHYIIFLSRYKTARTVEH